MICSALANFHAERKTMTKNQLEITSELLNLAATEFSNHGCNDYDLPATPENIELVRTAERFITGDELEPNISDDGETVSTNDAWLMRYLAYCLAE
jgi:hypothetical protein